MDRSYRLGVDIGGTFTDVILLGDSGRAWVGKTLTTTHDPSAGVETAVRDIFKRSGVRASEVRDVIHGTTLVTNAIIERSGAKTALLTTYGFRDTLEIARERRYDISDLFLEMPEPLVPRRLRFGVKERVLKGGEVETSPERRQIDEIAAELGGAAGPSRCDLFPPQLPLSRSRADRGRLAQMPFGRSPSFTLM